MLRLSLSFLFSALTTALTADLICCSRWGEGTNALLPPSPGSPPVSVFAIRDTTYTQTKQRRPPLPPPSPPTFRCSVARGPFIIIIIRFGGDSAFFSFSYSAWVPLFFEKGRSPPLRAHLGCILHSVSDAEAITPQVSLGILLVVAHLAAICSMSPRGDVALSHQLALVPH